MEGTETLILLDEILTGKIIDSKAFLEKVSNLHVLLSNSSKSLLRAASMVSSRLNEKILSVIL